MDAKGVSVVTLTRCDMWRNDVQFFTLSTVEQKYDALAALADKRKSKRRWQHFDAFAFFVAVVYTV